MSLIFSLKKAFERRVYAVHLVLFLAGMLLIRAEYTESSRMEEIRSRLLLFNYPVSAAMRSAESVREAFLHYVAGVTKSLGLAHDSDQSASYEIIRESAKLRMLSLYLDSVLEENLQLKSLLRYSGELEKRRSSCHVASRVFYHSRSSFHTAMVPLGRGSGVKEGQIVINQEGLVGKVYSVGNSHSSIMLMDDPRFRVTVTTSRSGEVAILSGGSLTLDFVKKPDVRAFEALTNESALLFEKDAQPYIKVGKIHSQRADKPLTVVPYAKTSLIKDVLILMQCDAHEKT